MALKKIQTTITGFAGKPATVFSSYNPASKVLVVALVTDYRTAREDGCLVITNVTDIDRDLLFPSDKLLDALQAYYRLVNGVAADGKSSRLDFTMRARNANPVGVAQLKELDPTGPKYQLSADMTNAQVAVLVTCWHCVGSDTIDDTLDALDELTDYSLSRVNEDSPIIFI